MNWKSFLKKMLFPPIWITVLLVVFSTVALVNVFLRGIDTSPIAIIIYVISFYTLTVFCVACFIVIPKYYKTAKKRVYENKYANRYFSDIVFKTHVNLYRSLAINLIYVIVNAVSAVVYQTYWFGIFAVYYAIMAIMRFLLARYARKNQIGINRITELKRSRCCAYILMTVNIVLSGVIFMMIYYDRGFEYQGSLIYLMALYTFYITITAIIDMVRYRKYKSPVMSMSVAIKLAAALFSMLFLETAMFSQFGQDTSAETKKMLIAATGAVISVIVVSVSIYMIVCWTKEIKQKKE